MAAPPPGQPDRARSACARDAASWRRGLTVGWGLLALLATCSTAPSSSTESREQALERLRQRLAEHQSEMAQDEEPEAEPDDSAAADSEPARPAEEPSFLLPPRYSGALPDGDPLVLGVYPLRTRRDPIIDGDTVAVDGLDASLRLACLDAEEIFHGHPEVRDEAFADCEGYMRSIYADAQGIPKFSTPMGEMARDYAHDFFAGDTEVRLEFDDLEHQRGYYGRYLVYVYVRRDGVWINYNLEAVRAGISPYFNKYGDSERFHQEFLEAEQEAREAHRGIWDPTLCHYPDYDARRTWWNRRAQAINDFRAHHGTDPTYVELNNETQWQHLSEMDGQTITVFATPSDFHLDWSPPRVLLGHRVTDDFTLVGFAPSVFDSYNLTQYTGEYVYVRGRLGFYDGHPQFVVDHGIQVWVEP